MLLMVMDARSKVHGLRDQIWLCPPDTISSVDICEVRGLSGISWSPPLLGMCSSGQFGHSEVTKAVLVAHST